jgi:hypothetical protein
MVASTVFNMWAFAISYMNSQPDSSRKKSCVALSQLQFTSCVFCQSLEAEAWHYSSTDKATDTPFIASKRL